VSVDDGSVGFSGPDFPADAGGVSIERFSNLNLLFPFFERYIDEISFFIADMFVSFHGAIPLVVIIPFLAKMNLIIFFKPLELHLSFESAPPK
jgi:hypothetical protein